MLMANQTVTAATTITTLANIMRKVKHWVCRLLPNNVDCWLYLPDAYYTGEEKEAEREHVWSRWWNCTCLRWQLNWQSVTQLGWASFIQSHSFRIQFAIRLKHFACLTAAQLLFSVILIIMKACNCNSNGICSWQLATGNGQLCFICIFIIIIIMYNTITSMQLQRQPQQQLQNQKPITVSNHNKHVKSFCCMPLPAAFILTIAREIEPDDPLSCRCCAMSHAIS